MERGAATIAFDIHLEDRGVMNEAVLECQFARRDLELLDEVGGAGEQHAPAFFDERENTFLSVKLLVDVMVTIVSS